MEELKASDISSEFQYAGQSLYGTNSFDKTAWQLTLMPALGLEITGAQLNGEKDIYSFAWNVYGEISLTPIQN